MDKLIPLLDKALGALAQKLGIGLDVLWSVLIAQAGIQAKINHFYMIALGIGFSIVIIAMVYCVIWGIRNNWGKRGYP